MATERALTVGRADRGVRCPKGHRLTKDNLITEKQRTYKGRYVLRNKCKTCHNAQARRRYANKRYGGQGHPFAG